MNKKAGLNMSIKSIIGLIMGIALLFFVLDSFGGAILGMIFPDLSQLTEESLSSLNEIVLDLKDGDNSSVLFYMSDGFQLVAFDKSANDRSGDVYVYERPSACFSKSCLVICKESGSVNACKDSNFVYAYSFEAFEETNTDSGIVTVVQGKYVNLELEMKNSTLSIKEAEEK